MEIDNRNGKGYSWPLLKCLALFLSTIALAKEFSTKPSNLEQEIIKYSKAAQEAFVKGDTLLGNNYIVMGIKLCEEVAKDGKVYFDEHLSPRINEIYESSFYDKETGSVQYGTIVDKPKGKIGGGVFYQSELFPKEIEEEK